MHPRTDAAAVGGASRDRTGDLLLAKQALSQLSYGPGHPVPPRRGVTPDMVGLGGLEPPTSPLSGVRSNQLSYRPQRAGVRSARRGTRRLDMLRK